MFLNILRNRRSIRKFQDKPIEHEKMNNIAEALLRSPSSRGLNPWEFIFITEKTLLNELSKSKEQGSEFLKNAALGIVILAQEDISDVWIEDTSIAATIAILTAESLGLGSCWIQIRNRKHNNEISAENYIAKILQIPREIKIEAIIAIGYPEEQHSPHSMEELQYNKIFLNQYGTKP